MCLILHKSTKPQIATEDIICYKEILLIDISNTPGIPLYKYYSIFNNTYQWTLNQIHETEIVGNTRTDYDLCWCDLSYDILNADIISRYDDGEEHYDDYISYSKGFHTATDIILHDNLFGHSVIAKCIIPKGATYYHSLIEYVSNKLIITEIL